MTILSRLSALTLAALTLVPLAPSRADAYQVDCAILLCLAGGWPASPECTHARAVFIRRVTPYPVEPPLQIWRCPMGAAFQVQPGQSPAQRLYDIAFQNPPSQSLPLTNGGNPPTPFAAVLHQFEDGSLPSGAFLELVQQYSDDNGTADIDISGNEFDFVRSIKVWDVRHYSHRPRGRDEECQEQFSLRLGTYGTQGDFHWNASHPGAAPSWVIPSRECRRSNGRRGVGVEWRDHEGNHGWEWVAY